MTEENRISDRQATLFDLAQYQIEPVPDNHWESIDLLPNPEVREQVSVTVLPNPKVREQPLEPSPQSPNLRIVSIKGQKYFLTPSKSTKQLPEGKGWREIKKQKGNLYLYLRWREGETQKSGCLGRVDKITSQLE